MANDASQTRARKVFKWLRVYVVPALGLICTGAGIGIGCFIRLSSHDVLMSDTVLVLFSLPGEILSRMLKVIILPLVVSSTFSATCRLPANLLGKMSLRILLFYLTTSLMSAIVGVLSVFIFQPSTWDLLNAKTNDYVQNDNYWLSILLDFIRNLLPENLIQAFYQHSQTVVITADYVSYHYEPTVTTEMYTTETFNTDINMTELPMTNYDYDLITNLTMSSVINDTFNSTSSPITEYLGRILDDGITESPFEFFEEMDKAYLMSSNLTDFNVTSGNENVTTTSTTDTGNVVKDVLETTKFLNVYRSGPNLLGLIAMHAAFGIASRNVNNKLVILVESFCTALHLIMIKMSQAIMWYFPIGVFFLTLTDVMSTGEVYPFSMEMARFAAAMASAMLLHGVVTLSLLYWFLIRKNPFVFWRHNWAPFLVVFGTKSRATSLPFSMKCLEDKSSVDQRVTRLFLPLGSALNSDGDAIYSAVSTLFLVQLSGVELNLEHYLYVGLLSFVLSFTSSTLHTKGIVYMHQLLIVQMSTQQLAVLSSLDWIGGRLRETVNVISDAVAVSVTQHYSTEELRNSDPGKYNLDKLNNQFIPKTYSRASTDSESNGETTFCERFTDV